jgi:hypothetical protein
MPAALAICEFATHVFEPNEEINIAPEYTYEVAVCCVRPKPTEDDAAFSVVEVVIETTPEYPLVVKVGVLPVPS